MAADQDTETHDDESNGNDEPIVGAKWARSRTFWTVAIRPRAVVHLILRFTSGSPAYTARLTNPAARNQPNPKTNQKTWREIPL